MTLHFPDLDTLHLLLTDGVIPADVATSAVRTGAGDGRSVLVEPSRPIPAEVLEKMRPFGVEMTDDAGRLNDRPAGHWLELFPPQSAEIDVGVQTPVLFEVRTAARLAALVTEVLRLGNDRQSLAAIGSPSETRFLVRVVGPPYYSLLSSLDRDDGNRPRAFVERAPRLWVEVGLAHPLESAASVPAGHLVLLRAANEWETWAEPVWCDVYDVIRLATVAEERWADDPPAEPFHVSVTLTPGGRLAPASLWIIRDRVEERLDAFVQSADERLLSRLAFAIGRSDGRTVGVLRLRPSKLPPPGIELEAVPCQPHLRLPNLFVPIGHQLRPPLRRETVRKLLAPDPAVITWLATGADGSLTAESLPDESFRPLVGWVDHVLDRDRAALTEWVQSAEFGFAGAVAVEEPVQASSKPAAAAVPKPIAPPARRQRGERPTRLPARPPSAAPAVPAHLTPEVSKLRAQLAEVENCFLQVDGPLDHPDRQALWPVLARLNAELRLAGEAALDWTHALWESPPSEEVLAGWVRSEDALLTTTVADDNVQRLLNAPPSLAAVRSIAAVLAWSAATRPPAVVARLAEFGDYLIVHEAKLPVRPLWLAWDAWSRLAGGDALALARARDRLLTRLLDRGLSAEMDLPAFLRFAGRPDAERVRELSGWVTELRDVVRRWYRSQTLVNLQTDPTAAYVDLLFAFAAARLGEVSVARELVRGADAVLSDARDDTREAHAFLYQAFAWRVEEVIAGRPHGGPLPQELLDYLAHMHAEAAGMSSNEQMTRKLAPYAVERLREQSRVLEPQEKFDPYRHNTARFEGNELVRAAASLPDVRDPVRLMSLISDLLRQAGVKADLRVRLLAESVPLAGRLGSEGASTLLDRIVPALEAAGTTNDIPQLETRMRLIERGLFFAAHYDRSDLVTALVARLLALVESDHSAAVLDTAGGAVGQTLRSLRKLGLRDETLRIIDRMAEIVLRGVSVEVLAERQPRDWHKRLLTLLHLAAGWRFFDQSAKAEPVLTAARSVLARSDRPPAERVQPALYPKLLSAWVTASGVGAPAEARGRLVELFTEGRLEKLSNTMTTNVFYSWFHLNVAEAVVLTLASDDFTLGPVTRRWLDEDEYLVRRRIHRDVRAALERG